MPKSLEIIPLPKVIGIDGREKNKNILIIKIKKKSICCNFVIFQKFELKKFEIKTSTKYIPIVEINMFDP